MDGRIDVVCLLSPPGAGKDTLVKNISNVIDHFPLSFSEALRYSGVLDPKIAEEVSAAKREHRLADRSVVKLAFDMYRRGVVPAGRDVMLNGFPRDEYQVDLLFDSFTGRRTRIILFDLDCPDELCSERILNGGGRIDPATGFVREDDTREGVANRLREYRSHHKPIVHRFMNRRREGDVIRKVNASLSEVQVRDAVLSLLLSKREPVVAG